MFLVIYIGDIFGVILNVLSYFDHCHLSVHTFEQVFLDSPWANFLQISCASSFKGGLKICSTGHCWLNKMAAMPICGKNF